MYESVYNSAPEVWAHYDSAVSCFNHYTMRTHPTGFLKVLTQLQGQFVVDEDEFLKQETKYKFMIRHFLSWYFFRVTHRRVQLYVCFRAFFKFFQFPFSCYLSIEHFCYVRSVSIFYYKIALIFFSIWKLICICAFSSFLAKFFFIILGPVFIAWSSGHSIF